MQPSESSGRERGFHGRTNIVFATIFLGVLLVCFHYDFRTRLAFVCALLASFLGAGVWLVMVEDILSPSKRKHHDSEEM